MRRKLRFLAISLGGAVLAGGVVPAPSFAQNNFTCEASVVRVSGEGPLAALQIEPFVANPQNDPCRDASAGLIPNLLLPGNLGSASVLFARTDDPGCSPSTTPCQPGDAATADSGVLLITLTVPGLPPIHAQVLTSHAEARCEGTGPPALSGNSRVVALTVGTTTIDPVTTAHQHVTIPVPAPVGPIVVHINHQETTPTSITQRAVFIETGLADVVIAEAIADFNGNPCAGGNGVERFPGWMTGGGWVAEAGTDKDRNNEGTVDPGDVEHHSFSIDCFFPTGDNPGKKDHFNVHFTDDTGEERGSFRTEVITDARCTFEEDEGTAGPPRSRFNQIEGEAIGICKTGGTEVPAMASFRFTDEGEPGRQDEAEIHVSSPVEPLPILCNLDSEGNLDGGNHQAHQTRKQFNTPPSTTRRR